MIGRGATTQEDLGGGSVRVIAALEPPPSLQWIERFLAARAHDVTRRALVVLGHPRARSVATIVVSAEQVPAAIRGIDRMISEANRL